MSDEETIIDSWRDSEAMSDSETMSDALIGDRKDPSKCRRAYHKFKRHQTCEQSRILGIEAAVQTSIEDAIFKRCLSRLKESASDLKVDSQLHSMQIDTLKAKNNDLQHDVSALEEARGDLQLELEELRSEVKGLRDEVNSFRMEASRKRKADTADIVEEIYQEDAPTLKRKRMEIRTIIYEN